jgi:hypothetical protein
MAGDTARAEVLVQDLGKRFPLDTQMQSLWLPAIQAQLALNRKSPALAADHLQHTLPPIEYGQIGFVANLSCLYPTYVRGEAYLAAGQGTAAAAAAEFQKIIDHSGIVWNCWTGALAHLGVARANALQAKTSRAWTPMLPAPGHSWPTRISSRSGKTPTPTSPSSSKPRRSTRSCSSRRSPADRAPIRPFPNLTGHNAQNPSMTVMPMSHS